jgi:hypothetical protein
MPLAETIKANPSLFPVLFDLGRPDCLTANLQVHNISKVASKLVLPFPMKAYIYRISIRWNEIDIFYAKV